MKKTAIQPTRAENYPEWYQQVIQAADLAETSPTRGCMVIKPWGYAIWENIQQDLDRRFKATGHVNAYFPLLIPLSHLEREAAHVDGFAKECAVVTHHRLECDENNKLVPAGKLDEPYVIRPTSETIIGEMYSKWIQSYRDLPVLINQWANVMRWEMRTRLFLRTSEFLWQEGHTAHATQQEAEAETFNILDLYEDFASSILAIPVVKGEKTISERFPGALHTYCIEAMMQDKKALQAGTSHFLGQNFSRASNIQFQDQDGQQQYAWTTSWGVSTRLIGGLIMTHSDDNGLVLPPRISPLHAVIIPIYRNDEEGEQVLAYCKKLKQRLGAMLYHQQALCAHIDDRDMRGGEKSWDWIKKGVPLRVEIGPRDIASDSVFMARRDHEPRDKQSISYEHFCETIQHVLDEIQMNLLQKATQHRDENTHEIDTLDAFKALYSKNGPGGFALCYAINDASIDELIKPMKVSARCIPSDQPIEPGTCIFSGQKTAHKILFGAAY